jgi:hypothetical protein
MFLGFNVGLPSRQERFEVVLVQVVDPPALRVPFVKIIIEGLREKRMKIRLLLSNDLSRIVEQQDGFIEVDAYLTLSSYLGSADRP